MKVGSARFCLTPQKKEFYLIGYRSENRYYPSSGVHDDIFCNALLFEDGGKQTFLFSADFLEFEEEMAEDVKTILNDEFGIERDMILLAATHNHSSVVSYHKSWHTEKFDNDYYDYLIEVIKNSFRTCQENLTEATAKYGKKVIPGYYGNRNHAGQLADNEVIVVKFYNEQQEPFAGIVNWAVHSTVISAENTWLTSEWAGTVSKKLKDEFGFYPTMMVGAAGDCSNRHERQGNDFDELERVSTAMAKEIAEIEIDTDLKLGEITYQAIYHTIHHGDFHLDAKGLVIKLGELILFVFPGELGSKFGVELKQESPTFSLVCGYTNGYYGYFLPMDEYGLSFETTERCKIPKGEPEKLVYKLKQAAEFLSHQ